MTTSKNLKTKAALGLAATALAAGALTVGSLGGAEASAPPGKPIDASPTSTGADNIAGRAGWQGRYTYTLPTGSGGVFFHYPCPTGFTARSGAFDVNGVGQAGVKIVGQGPRWDMGYTEWWSTLLWPAGSPAGTQISYDVYCTRGAV